MNTSQTQTIDTKQLSLSDATQLANFHMGMAFKFAEGKASRKDKMRGDEAFHAQRAALYFEYVKRITSLSIEPEYKRLGRLGKQMQANLEQARKESEQKAARMRELNELRNPFSPKYQGVQ